MDKWDSRFMEMAHVIAGWTSCYMPGRSIGCVIVKDKRIMTTGYNGAPAGLKTCRERGECMRRKLGIAVVQQFLQLRQQGSEVALENRSVLGVLGFQPGADIFCHYHGVSRREPDVAVVLVVMVVRVLSKRVGVLVIVAAFQQGNAS